MSDSPARHIKLQGASNFRDLGGYPTRDGRRTRWRQIFRSNHLGHLTAGDVAMVRSLGVRTAFDFRGREERAAALCGMQEVIVRSLPIEPTVVAALRARLTNGALTVQDALEIMRESYRNYVRRNTHCFRALFEHLLSADGGVVIHCTAGKDRTGFACALILHALDVPQEIIDQDYLLTNQHYRRDLSASPDLPDEVRAAIGRVDATFLAAGFEAVRDLHGNIDGYLRDGLGLGASERNALAARYLQP